METDQARPAKRRRLGTACQSCRLAKARCEVQQDVGICHRCHVLDLECELPRRIIAPSSSNDGNLEQRLKRAEQMIARLSEVVFPSSATSSKDTRRSSATQVDTPSDSGHADTLISHNYPKPVEILQDLQSELYEQSQRHPSDRPKSLDVVSVGLLAPEISSELLQTSIERYGKWISLTDATSLPKDFARSCPFLMSVLCLLAARFHPAIPLQTAQDMYGHVKRLAADALIETPPISYSTIQGLTLLCIFSPTVRTYISLDSWHLSGSTGSHAIVSFELGKSPGSSHDNSTEQLRLWSGLCLAHLQYSIGSGRPLCISTPLVEESRRLLKTARATAADESLIAELTLYLALHRTLRNTTTDTSAETPLKTWHSLWGPHLDTTGPPTTLKLSHWFAQLLHHRLNIPPPSQHIAMNTTTSPHVPAWQKSATIVSQFIRHDPKRVSDLPDFMFFIASYAALVLCESAIDHHLVENLQSFFDRMRCGDSHVAYRHGKVLQRALQRLSEKGEDNSAGLVGATNKATEADGATRGVNADGSGPPGTTDPNTQLLQGTGETAFMGMPQPELADFDALAGFDIFGEYFTVESLL